ncbi:helix-turn-helix transcriptional regulator [Planctomicrobium piriforme]|uniref:HTH-type transcriptional regulator / antitoxin HigA n=1 Tax=Planctomicrobium piriforme TaxID=1576369 RepID=A0A1I3EGJ0_9PLAN|nr:hypothetical protein [Planctomicrobium piriforme]SFH98062.1 HTH-type transcriptional regulator / antitoxin HigA [Planctomicrobium piriforme]
MTPNPAFAFHPGEYLKDEMEARGITAADLAEGDPVNTLAIEMYVACAEPGCEHRYGIRLGDLAEVIAKGLGTSVQIWLNLESSYLRNIGEAK